LHGQHGGNGRGENVDKIVAEQDQPDQSVWLVEQGSRLERFRVISAVSDPEKKPDSAISIIKVISAMPVGISFN